MIDEPVIVDSVPRAGALMPGLMLSKATPPIVMRLDRSIDFGVLNGVVSTALGTCVRMYAAMAFRSAVVNACTEEFASIKGWVAIT